MNGIHFRRECMHGIVVEQCRCWSPEKLVTIVTCPTWCPQYVPTLPDNCALVDLDADQAALVDSQPTIGVDPPPVAPDDGP